MRLAGSKLGRIAVAASGSALLIVGTFGTADAATSPPDTKFSAQASAAGLTGAEARTLQNSINAQIRESGGTQTAANEIALPDGSEMLFPLPGEKHARDLDTPVQTNGTRAPSSCGSYTFCAYSGTNFTGTVKRQKLCNEPMDITWSGNGSWSNNQSSGTRARMYGSSGQLIYTTPGAYSEDRSGSWTPVHKVDAC
ncbi:peptidase inhibitor family I36 protein [Streptomyces sp. T-3]|nr:peptidase inhibitor family I36 protein [Streptomyces sp. T-3]